MIVGVAVGDVGPDAPLLGHIVGTVIENAVVLDLHVIAVGENQLSIGVDEKFILFNFLEVEGSMLKRDT